MGWAIAVHNEKIQEGSFSHRIQLLKKIKELLLYVNEITLEGISVVKHTWCNFSTYK